MSWHEALTPAERRVLGSFGTPAPIVDHLVRRTIDPVVPPGRSANEVIRILDPAVGDGVFLHAARARIAARGGGRFTLHGVDVDPGAIRAARSRLGPGTDLVRGDALGARFPIPAGEGFDAVIGNPPWGGWNRALPPARRARYRRLWRTARGILEPSALFIERATTLLREGGRLGLVLPDYLLLKRYPILRRHLLDHYVIEEMIHWGRVFRGVNLDAFTLVARRGRTPRAWSVACRPDGPTGRRIRVPRDRFTRDPDLAFNIFLDGASAALIDRLEAEGTPLGDWLELHEGIHSGNVRARIFLPPEDPRIDPGDPRQRPLILGRDEIRPFRLRWGGWRVRYDRAAIRKESGEYAGLGRVEWFEADKLLVRRTGDRIVAARDPDGHFASNNLFVGIPRRGSTPGLDYLEAWLNSSLATWCFRARQPRVGRIFAEVKIRHLARLPVPAPPGREAAERIARWGRALRRSGASDGPRIRRHLDEAFHRLAGLDAGDVRRVEGDFASRPHFL